MFTNKMEKKKLGPGPGSALNKKTGGYKEEKEDGGRRWEVGGSSARGRWARAHARVSQRGPSPSPLWELGGVQANVRGLRLFPPAQLGGQRYLFA